MPRRITPQTTLDNLKKEAKRWLKALRDNDRAARARLDRANPKAPAIPVLRDVQLALAREYGFADWIALKAGIEALSTSKVEAVRMHEELAADLVTVYATGDEQAMARLREHYKTSFTWKDVRAQVWSALYKVRQAKGAPEAFQLPEARELMARRAGFPNWRAYMQSVAKNTPVPTPAYEIKRTAGHLRLRRQLERRDWDVVLGAIRDGRVSIIDAGGEMTDEALAQVAQIEHVTELDLSGSRALTDHGLQVLARMPQLESLNVTGTNTSDRALEVLANLPHLRRFQATWQKEISDTGVANLRWCEELEEVNVMGTATGDGLIEALREKPHLHHLNTGAQVTDRGAAMLRDFPRFRTWGGGDCRYELMTMGHEPTWLLLDGSFTDNGLATVSQLEGLSGLNLFWNVNNVTAAGIAKLVAMPNLRHLRCFDELADDSVLTHIGCMPHLQMLVIQGAVATDAGFEALARSHTLEYIWGRECPNLTSRGFSALLHMPRLRGLGVSCKNVDDHSLASLPDCPQLREFMPMDVPDAGFRHLGRCHNLERLWCMYCRETGDVATEHIAGLHLKSYYAGLTQITDRSLEILGRMSSLEVVELFETKSVTDKGLASLAKLPNLQRVELSGLPNVTLAGTRVFPARVQVNWDV